MKTSYLSLLLILIGHLLHAQTPTLTASTYSGCSGKLISFTLKAAPNTRNDKVLELMDDNFGSIGYVIQSSTNDSIYVGTIVLDEGTYEPQCNVYVGTTRQKIKIERPVTIKHTPNSRFIVSSRSGLDSASQKEEITLQLSYSKKEDSITSVTYTVKKTFNTRGERVEQIVDIVQSNGYKSVQKIKLSPGRYSVSCSVKTSKKDKSCFNESNLPSIEEFSIGHLALLRVEKAYLGYNTRVYDSVFYWQPTSVCQITGDVFNTSCIDRTRFFQLPDSCNKRRAWYRRVNNYLGPAFKEKMLFDFDNNGTIDGEPNTADTFWMRSRHSFHKYSSLDKHNSLFWSRDSLGQWQKDSVEVEVVELKLNARFVDLPADTFKSCLPKMIEIGLGNDPLPFEVKRTIVEINSETIELNGLTRKIAVPVKNSGTLKGSVTLVGPGGIKHKESISGPYVLSVSSDFDFSIENSRCDTGLVTFKPRDYSLVDEYVWSYGDGFAEARKSPENVSNRYPNPGKYKVSLLTVGKLIDPITNDTLKCSHRVEKEVLVAESLLAKFNINRNGNKLTIIKEGYGPSQEFRLYSLQNNRKFLGVITSNKEIPVAQHGAGDYEVCMSVDNGSCQDSVCHQFWYAPIGTTEPDVPYLSIFPNPGRGMFTVELPKSNATNFQLEVINSTGKRILDKRLQMGDSRIDLSNQPSGVYFLRLKSDKEVYETKYLKQ